jgi:AcrR family transcriptional regulator
VARPIGTPDDALLDAAGHVLMTEGPSGFTLAKAAASAGVSAATFVKRFGSKERLFLRLSQRWADSLDRGLAEATRGVDSPLRRLRVAALYNYHDLDNPTTAAKQLAALAIDLQNDEMRDWLHADPDGRHGGRLPGLVGPPRRVADPPARGRPGRPAVWMGHG